MRHHLVCLSLLSVLHDTHCTGKGREGRMSIRPSDEKHTETARHLCIVGEGIHEAQVSWLHQQGLFPHYKPCSAWENTIE